MGEEAIVGGASQSSGLASAGGAIVGAVAGAFISASFAKESAQKQRELQADLDKLSLAQQKEL